MWAGRPQTGHEIGHALDPSLAKVWYYHEHTADGADHNTPVAEHDLSATRQVLLVQIIDQIGQKTGFRIIARPGGTLPLRPTGNWQKGRYIVTQQARTSSVDVS